MELKVSKYSHEGTDKYTLSVDRRVTTARASESVPSRSFLYEKRN